MISVDAKPPWWSYDVGEWVRNFAVIFGVAGILFGLWTESKNLHLTLSIDELTTHHTQQVDSLKAEVAAHAAREIAYFVALRSGGSRAADSVMRAVVVK